MNKDVCFELGYIVKKHGLQGEVSVHLDTDNPENYSSLESVFIEIDQKLVPFFIKSIKVQGDKALIRFEEVEGPDYADELKGSKLFLPLDFLPALKGNQFYFHEIIGFHVSDKGKGNIGPITDVLDAGPQTLFAVDYNGKEVLIPVNDDIVLSVNRESKSVLVNLPEGLLDIYVE